MASHLPHWPARCRSGLHGLVDRVKASPAALFLHELHDAPASIGAICPSSGQLARAMVAAVPLAGSGLVVELGAGTGCVTRELLARGVAPERLRVVEQSQRFAQHLRKQFASIPVLQGDAAQLSNLLPSGSAVDAIVSSLPFRSLPAQIARDVLNQWRTLLPEGAVVVQFTYALMAHPASMFSGFSVTSEHIVLANLPPAKVMVLRRTPLARAA